MSKEINSILIRLSKLEQAVFSQAIAKKVKSKKDYTGPSGGLAMLAEKGFFSKKRTTAEAFAEMQKNDYHYRLSVVQTALNRMSVKNGKLTTFREAGKKVYVIRK
ncbi:MAG TPA: hypothetical protein VHQ20_02590 [Patescibacteria group bacterium]|jgi:hypothetical protein|nr:hypothetical protein [Patescibacteria group bacterium]